MLNVYAENVGGVWFAVAFQGEEIFATNFGTDGKSVLDGLLRSIPFDVPFQKVETATRFADHAIAILKDLFDGKGASENLPLAMQHLSGYTQKVLKITSLIPLGYVASYGSVTKVAGGSPRAVGRVMALNPFAPVIPCHRVVGSDLSLVGYGGGLKMKLELLKRERRGYDSERDVSVDNEWLRVFPVEFVLKKVSKR